MWHEVREETIRSLRLRDELSQYLIGWDFIYVMPLRRLSWFVAYHRLVLGS